MPTFELFLLASSYPFYNSIQIKLIGHRRACILHEDEEEGRNLKAKLYVAKCAGHHNVRPSLRKI